MKSGCDTGQAHSSRRDVHSHGCTSAVLLFDSFPSSSDMAECARADGEIGVDARIDREAISATETVVRPYIRRTPMIEIVGDEYDRIFRVPTVFGCERNALLIDDDWTHYTVAKTTRYAFGVLSEHAKALLESLETAKTVRGRVEALLIPILHRGDPNIERTAQKLGLSRKTLYRQLKEEGTTYEKLLDELRHRLALHYLDGKKVSVNETAYLVGFSDPSAFSRAFRRWTGVSPRKRE